MPNGDDKSLVRLTLACALFKQRHGCWPNEARLAPGVLRDLALRLDVRDFERLTDRLRLRTSRTAVLTVARGRQTLTYTGTAQAEGLPSDEALDWLGIRR
ncbi:MAG: hypothetical protein PVG27_01275 [Chloroflexota bacterium]|jgi:hypothetical protein